MLSFPNNNFDNRQPGSNEEILKISREIWRYISVLAKISVNGNDEHPLFTHLKNEQPGIFGSPIKWNFTKFIIDRQGNVVNRFLPMEDPLDISANIEILLQESSS